MKAHTVERQPPSSLKPGALVSRAKNDMSGVNSGNQICTPLLPRIQASFLSSERAHARRHIALAPRAPCKPGVRSF